MAVVAPSGTFDPRGLARGLALLRSWGTRPVLGRSCATVVAASVRSSPADQIDYLSAPDGDRVDDLTWALTDSGIDAVWCARGGYGLTRILSQLPWHDVVPGRPVLGFSDCTALLLSLQQRTSAVPIHAQVLHSLAEGLDASSIHAHRALLAGEQPAAWEGLPAVTPERSGDMVEGPLVGGNLTTIASLAGTQFAMRAAGAVVLLEDVSEAPYRIDRMLVTLRDSGAFTGARAVGVGSLSARAADLGRMGPRESAAVRVLGDLGIPVVVGLPFGHSRRNRPFVVGSRARVRGGRIVHEGLWPDP